MEEKLELKEEEKKLLAEKNQSLESYYQRTKQNLKINIQHHEQNTKRLKATIASLQEENMSLRKE